MKFRKTFQFQT